MNEGDKILLLTPAYSASGGIKNYFRVLEDRFTLPVEYMTRGARQWPYRKGLLKESWRAWKDLRIFKEKLKTRQYYLVQTSTSLGSMAVIRDGLFVRAAKRKKLKVIVFFRGWDKKFEARLENKFLGLFRKIFFKADAMIVLSLYQQSKLKAWGYKNEIYVESTIVDDKLFDGTELLKEINERFDDGHKTKFNLLFLARVEREKGIYETIDTYEKLKEDNTDLDLSLTIAGEGKELSMVKAYVAKKELDNIAFSGYVEGGSKTTVLKKADVYILPSYTEGMPNSMLEAMAFGLPVVSRSVGAIPDFIKNSVNGFHTESKDPRILAGLVQQLINDRTLRKNMAMNNYTMAHEKYSSSAILQRIEAIYASLKA